MSDEDRGGPDPVHADGRASARHGHVPTAIRAWSRAAHTAGPAASAPEFPFTEATRTLRAYGTGALPAELAAALVEAAATAWSRAGTAPAESWFTAHWLRCATATATATQTYETYTMCGLLDQYCRAGTTGYEETANVLSAALVADLIQHELRMAHRGRSGARSAAATRLAGDLRQALSPDSARPRPLGPDTALRFCARLISGLCRNRPSALRRIVECTPLPATTEPDEYLFNRSVQIMEILSGAAAAQAADAGRCGPRELPELVSRLGALTRTLRHAARLFHIVSTIDAGQFARIRAATYGTGALQSPAFAALERYCRGERALRPELLTAVPVAGSPLPDVPLGQALEGLRLTLEVPAAVRLEDAVAAVDTAWLRWKRAHHGVARRIIGDVPGTGRTDGVSYLSRHMNAPLLTHHDRQETPGGPHDAPGVPPVRSRDRRLDRRLLGTPRIPSGGPGRRAGSGT
ncbi:hypothetical protein [Streptomyces sp. AK02-01A]|uniref:hypothetical protein n=1 Tax=Streptomyces sp. AK02-01A TaxID=3028648 RepID=UPI0029B9600B|nr:hypothetical protein [Streptomyces sp. AK02-01A]MDX3852394.1 hypothetical protein [Streptomyces sp. AK02-01A]